MGKYAYVVWYYNGEEWEDAKDSVKRVFDSWEKAEEYLNNQDGYSKSMKRSLVFDIDSFKSTYINMPIWENEIDNYYDNYWIEIFDLSSGKKILYDNEHIFLIK